MNQRGILFAVVIFSGFAHFAPLGTQAQSSDATRTQLSESQLYRRCHFHLTGRPIPLRDSRLASIEAEQMTALQACEEVLELGSLGADGRLKDTSNPMARAVLKTFLSFHKSWFSANTLEQIQDYSEELNRGSNDVYDAAEPALSLTRNLLANLSYREVLTATKGIRAIREEDDKIKRQFGFTVTMPSRRTFGNNTFMDTNLVVFESSARTYTSVGANRPAEDFMVMPLISVGNLVGIRETTESFTIPNMHLKPLSEIGRRGNVEPNLNFTYEFFKTYESGILGQTSFFLMNYGHGRGVQANGTTKLPRRWIQSGLESFLCSPLPSLRESDIASFVKPDSETPFRKASSCVRCHATLDQLASTGRNLITGSTSYFAIQTEPNASAKYPITLTSYNVRFPASGNWSDAPQENYHLQEPKGRVFMRSLNGQLIDRPVNGIKEVGKIWTEMDDFYTCAAKRYFEYFTGIQVPLYDRTDPNNELLNQNLSSEAIQLRSFVEGLGQKLMTEQSLKKMILEILSSEIYRSKNFQVGASK